MSFDDPIEEYLRRLHPVIRQSCDDSGESSVNDMWCAILADRFHGMCFLLTHDETKLCGVHAVPGIQPFHEKVSIALRTSYLLRKLNDLHSAYLSKLSNLCGKAATGLHTVAVWTAGDVEKDTVRAWNGFIPKKVIAHSDLAPLGRLEDDKKIGKVLCGWTP